MRPGLQVRANHSNCSGTLIRGFVSSQWKIQKGPGVNILQAVQLSPFVRNGCLTVKIIHGKNIFIRFLKFLPVHVCTFC
jgi:hypothetical protein